MFTISQIKDAHAKTKTGADFPRYIAALNGLGVRHYVTFVSDGHTVYSGDNGHSVATAAAYPAQTISPTLQTQEFKRRLEAHQRGETTYPRFCSDCGELGVARWEVDLKAMTCTYYGSADQVAFVEEITHPAGGEFRT